MGSNQKPIITLDGPSGSGKSTVSHRLALHFGIPCLDTGAMYRTIALRSIELGLSFDDEASIASLANRLQFHFSYRQGKPVIQVQELGAKLREVGGEIRTPEVSLAASRVAKLKSVRQALVKQQQEIGNREGAVVEGRDAGTVIFPAARLKFYMTASPEERAKRRFRELQERLGPKAPPLEEVLKEMIQRDEQDSNRLESPLKPAEDAQVVDTSGLDFDGVFKLLVQKIESSGLIKS